MFWGGGENAEENPADENRNDAAASPANANDANNDSENRVEGTVEVSQQSTRGTGAFDGLGIDALGDNLNTGLANLGDNIVNFGGDIGAGFDIVGDNLAEGTKKFIEEEEYIRRYVNTVLLHSMKL